MKKVSWHKVFARHKVLAPTVEFVSDSYLIRILYYRTQLTLKMFKITEGFLLCCCHYLLPFFVFRLFSVG
jgi:hypothetical protein